MARRGDGLVLRGKTWWLDFTHMGERHQARLGRNINRTVARELASVERAKALKQEAGIGRKRKDVAFDKAAEEFLKWAEANHRPKTATTYRENINQLKKSFSGKMLSHIHPFNVEKHKQSRISEGARIAANREISCLRNLFNRAFEWGKFEGANPAKQCKGNQAGRLTKEPLTRLRFLTHQEEETLLAAATEPLDSHLGWNPCRVKGQIGSLDTRLERY